MKTILPLLLLGAISASAADLRDTSFPTPDRQSLRIDMTVQPGFPAALIADGITKGRTRIMISVNNLGALTDSLVIDYTNEGFARSALDVIERWRFEPMLVRGEAVSCQVELLFSFEATGVVISLNPARSVELLMGLPEELVYYPRSLRSIDRIPTPILADPPHFPKELLDQGIHGEATVGFFIDETGVVRMPGVVAADHWELGFFALEAVRNWRFEPPTERGRPVLARVRQSFFFKPGGD